MHYTTHFHMLSAHVFSAAVFSWPEGFWFNPRTSGIKTKRRLSRFMIYLWLKKYRDTIWTSIYNVVFDGGMKAGAVVQTCFGSIHLIHRVSVLTWQQACLSPDLNYVIFELTDSSANIQASYSISGVWHAASHFNLQGTVSIAPAFRRKMKQTDETDRNRGKRLNATH